MSSVRGLVPWAAVSLMAACAPAPPDGSEQPAPAQAIVTLAPHLAELVFAAGAGDRLVGTVEFSDYPSDARRVRRIGDAFRFDYEAIVGLSPDLVLAWGSGNPRDLQPRLRALGLRVVTLEAERLEDIAAHMEQIGQLAGTRTIAATAAAQFRKRLAAQRAQFRGAPAIRVFLQLSARPYFTVTDRHFLGQGLIVCGGENIFGQLDGLTANVSAESILEAAPEVIIASGVVGHRAADQQIAGWRQWPSLPATRAGNLFVLDADLLSRPGPRILDGIAELCRVLDESRRRAAVIAAAR